MLLRSTPIAIAAAILAAAAASGEDMSGASSTRAAVPAKAHRQGGAPKEAPANSTGLGMDHIQFSQPNASPIGAQKPAHPAPLSRTGGASSEAQGGVSLDFKWRATNEKVDPYDAVRHTSGPEGPGDAVQGGIKLGF